MKSRESSIPTSPRRSQRGFSLIELLVVLALSGIIGAAATMTIHQVMTCPAIANNQNTAINQVRNAVYWISRDAQMAATVSVSPDVELLEVTWENWDQTESHISTYNLTGPPGGLKELRRTFDYGQPMLVAQYIDPNKTSCAWDETAGVLTITITANITAGADDWEETRTFDVNPRPID